MNPAATAPSGVAPVEEDLAEQFRPGHGIPSQDPNPAAARCTPEGGLADDEAT